MWLAPIEPPFSSFSRFPDFLDFQIPRFPDCQGDGRTLSFQLDPSPMAGHQICRQEPLMRPSAGFRQVFGGIRGRKLRCVQWYTSNAFRSIF